MDKLHQSQVKAYRDAAIQFVKEWAQKFPLQPMEEGDSKIAFVNRCIASITKASGANSLPNWKIENTKLTAMNEIRKRASVTYEKYHPAEEDVPVKAKENEKVTAAAATTAAPAIATAASGETEAANDTEDGEMTGEDGAITEDGEMTGDDDDEVDKDATPGNGKYVHPNRKKTKSADVQKNVALRKSTRVKNTFRGNNSNNNNGGRGRGAGGRGRGAQRGGRGGGGRGGGNRPQK